MSRNIAPVQPHTALGSSASIGSATEVPRSCQICWICSKAAAQRIRSTLRETDIHCRDGGKAFAFVFPDTALTEAGLLANRVRKSIAATAIPLGGGQAVPVSLKLGLVEVRGLPLDVALNQADQAMYRAKVARRNRTEFAMPLPNRV